MYLYKVFHNNVDPGKMPVNKHMIRVNIFCFKIEPFMSEPVVACKMDMFSLKDRGLQHWMFCRHPQRSRRPSVLC